MKKIILAMVDFDGCAGRKTEKDMQEQNGALFNFLIDKAEKHVKEGHECEIVFGMGSNRQCVHTEQTNFDDGKGSSANFLKTLTEELKRRLLERSRITNQKNQMETFTAELLQLIDQKNITTTSSKDESLHPTKISVKNHENLLMADIYNGLEIGDTLQAIQNNTPKNEAGYWIFDHGKVSTAYAFMQHLSEKHLIKSSTPTTIDCYFFDDQNDILSTLNNFFLEHPDYLPKNTTLSTIQYASHSKTSLEISSSISGTGVVIATEKKLLESALFDLVKKALAVSHADDHVKSVFEGGNFKVIEIERLDWKQFGIAKDNNSAQALDDGSASSSAHATRHQSNQRSFNFHAEMQARPESEKWEQSIKNFIESRKSRPNTAAIIASLKVELAWQIPRIQTCIQILAESQELNDDPDAQKLMKDLLSHSDPLNSENTHATSASAAAASAQEVRSDTSSSAPCSSRYTPQRLFDAVHHDKPPVYASTAEAAAASSSAATEETLNDDCAAFIFYCINNPPDNMQACAVSHQKPECMPHVLPASASTAGAAASSSAAATPLREEITAIITDINAPNNAGACKKISALNEITGTEEEAILVAFGKKNSGKDAARKILEQKIATVKARTSNPSASPRR